jgi:hypothetical protein
MAIQNRTFPPKLLRCGGHGAPAIGVLGHHSQHQSLQLGIDDAEHALEFRNARLYRAPVRLKEFKAGAYGCVPCAGQRCNFLHPADRHASGALTMQELQVLQIRTRRSGNVPRRIPRPLPPQRSIWPPITHRQSLVPSS